MFRGKESSNRIELSRLVQDLLNFGVLGSLQLWGWGGGGWLGGAPCTRAHARTRTRTCGKHDNFMQMAAPHWGNTWEFPMMSYVRACVCACVCTWVACTLSPSPPPSTHPPTPQGGDPRNHSKFNST